MQWTLPLTHDDDCQPWSCGGPSGRWEGSQAENIAEPHTWSSWQWVPFFGMDFDMLCNKACSSSSVENLTKVKLANYHHWVLTFQGDLASCFQRQAGGGRSQAPPAKKAFYLTNQEALCPLPMVVPYRSIVPTPVQMNHYSGVDYFYH